MAPPQDRISGLFFRRYGLGECLSLRQILDAMETSITLIEKIIRAKTALHLTLVAQRNDGRVDIGGGRIDDLLAEVDAGLAKYERMLVLFKNEVAAAIMEADAS